MEDQAAPEGFTPSKRPTVAVPKLFLTPPVASTRSQQPLAEKFSLTLSELQLTGGSAPRYEQQPAAAGAYSSSTSEAGNDEDANSSGDDDCDDFHMNSRVRFGRDADLDLHIHRLIETELDRTVDFDALLAASRVLCPNPRDKATVKQLADHLDTPVAYPSARAASIADSTGSPDCSAPTTGCRALGSSRAPSHRPATEPPQQLQQGAGSYSSQATLPTDMDAVSRTLSAATTCSRVPSAISTIPSTVSGMCSTVSGGVTSARSDRPETQQIQCILLLGSNAASGWHHGTHAGTEPQAGPLPEQTEKQLLAVVGPELLQLAVQRFMSAEPPLNTQTQQAGVAASCGEAKLLAVQPAGTQPEPHLVRFSGSSCPLSVKTHPSGEDNDLQRDKRPGLSQLLLPDQSCLSPVLFPGHNKVHQHSPTLLRGMASKGMGSSFPPWQPTTRKRVSEVSQDDRDQWDEPKLVIRDDSFPAIDHSGAHSSSSGSLTDTVAACLPHMLALRAAQAMRLSHAGGSQVAACTPAAAACATTGSTNGHVRQLPGSDTALQRDTDVHAEPMLTSRTARKQLWAGDWSEPGRKVRSSLVFGKIHELDVSEWLSSEASDEDVPHIMPQVLEEEGEGEAAGPSDDDDDSVYDAPLCDKVEPPASQVPVVPKLSNVSMLLPETHEHSQHPLRWAYAPTHRPGCTSQWYEHKPPKWRSYPGGPDKSPAQPSASAPPAYSTEQEQHQGEGYGKLLNLAFLGDGAASPVQADHISAVAPPASPVSQTRAWLGQACASPPSVHHAGNQPTEDFASNATTQESQQEQEHQEGPDGELSFGACSQHGFAWSLDQPFNSLCSAHSPTQRAEPTDPAALQPVPGAAECCDSQLQLVSLSLGGTLASTEASEVRLAELLVHGNEQQQQQPMTVVAKAYRQERAQHAIAEILALQRLRGWEGCVQLLGFCQCGDGGVQLFLQPCDCNLATWVDGQRVAAGAGWVLQALSIFKQLAMVLSKLHSKGMAHCDVKPQNVLMLAGRPVLADLSEARARGAGKGGLQLLEARGTEAYAAAEMHSASNERPVDAQAADVWSLGCVLYELLTGKMLFEGSCSNMRPLVCKADSGDKPANWLHEPEQQLLQRCCGHYTGHICRLLGRMCVAVGRRLSAAQVVHEVAGILA